MDMMDPLANLRDIHLPAAPSFWPPALGWWVLALLLLAGAVYFAYWWHHRVGKFRRIKKIAVTHVNALQEEYHQQQDPRRTAAALNQLLKRVALTLHPREDVAMLQGQAWLHFLDTSGNTQAFTQGEGQQLVTAPYQANASLDATALFDITRRWIHQATTWKRSEQK